MRRRDGYFNRKRKIREYYDDRREKYANWKDKVNYGGNPEHKRNPGDFDLTPPSSPRSAKSLCDNVNIFNRKRALEYLKRGLEKGMVSEVEKGAWPQNIWAVDENGFPLEAQLENQETGMYHGYPIPESDPFGKIVVDEWNRRQ